MIKQFFFIIIVILISGIQTNAQNVQVCISVNGTALPSHKNAIICRNGSVSLSATNCAPSPESNISIKWTNIDIPPHTDSLTTTVQAAEPGRWVVSITNLSTSMITKDTVFLDYPPFIGVEINDASFTPRCVYESLTLTGTPTGPVVSYQWYEYDTTSTLTKLTGETNNSYTFYKKLTYYILEVQDAHGCVNADTTGYIGQAERFVVDLTPENLTFCEGNHITLQSISPHVYYTSNGVPLVPLGGYTYTYGVINSAGNLTIASGNATTHVPPSYTTSDAVPNSIPKAGINKYYLILTKPFVCTNADTITVNVNPRPAFTYKDTILCSGASVTMIPTVTNGTPISAWAWSPATGLSTTNISQPTVSGLSADETYTVTATNSCGNASTSVLVRYNPSISVNASGDTTICRLPAGTAFLSGSATGGTPGGNPAYTYQWTPSESIETPNAASTSAYPSTSTVYTFTARDSRNCSSSKNISVTVYAPPIAPMESPQVLNEEKSIVLEAATSGNAGMDFVWRTDTSNVILTTNTSLPLDYMDPDTTRYIISVTDPSNNCINTDTIEIHSISNSTLMFVPNVFSPNALNPENQTLKVYGDNLHWDGFKWLVFNKWGNLMYETTSLSEAQYQGWNGGDVADGVYTYVIIGKFKNGKDIKESPQHKGSFSLIR